MIKWLVELAEECTREIDEANKKIREANTRLSSIDRQMEAFEHTISMLEQWPADALYGLHPEERRLLFRQIGLKITVSPAGQAGTHLGAARLSAEYALQGDQPEWARRNSSVCALKESTFS
jgi:hypothetical protein